MGQIRAKGTARQVNGKKKRKKNIGTIRLLLQRVKEK